LGNPTRPTQELFQAYFIGDSALAICYEYQPQVLAGRPQKYQEKGTPPIRPPILYVPPADLHEKQETEQIKDELPNRTKFQMLTYGTGNNKEYLVHIIAVMCLIK
jgi:hypothetical protein